MKSLKTSTAIALKFTLYVISMMILIGIAINMAFFVQRYRREHIRLQDNTIVPPRPGRFFNRPRSEIVSIPDSTDTRREFQNHKRLQNITHIDDTYIMSVRRGDTIQIIDITYLIQMQQQLLRLTLITIIIASGITFLLSRIVVRQSLRNIHTLVSYVNTLDLHNLHTPVPLSGPDDDEIRLIGSGLQQAIDTLQTQTASLKDFVAYASHELKTPLATLSGLVDLTEVKRDISASLPQIKTTISSMNNMISTLLQLTKRESQPLTLQTIDHIPIIRQQLTNIQQQFSDKHITCSETMPDQYITPGTADVIEIIYTNLLTNAYKFTPVGKNITITLQNHICIIHNEGSYISPDEQDKVRTRFWRATSQDQQGHGLGLSLTKTLVYKLGRDIAVSSDPKTGTSFILTMPS